MLPTAILGTGLWNGAGSMLRKLLKTREAAEVLGVSTATLEKWRQRGMGPEFQKSGPRTVRYHVDALAAYQVECTVKPAR